MPNSATTDRTLTERLFVRSFNVDEQGDLWVMASQTSENTKLPEGEEVRLKVGKSHPNRNKIFEQLSNAGTDIGIFEISREPVIPDGDPEKQFFQVRGIGGFLTEQERKLENSTYTKGLDEAVDTYYANRVGEETSKVMKGVSLGENNAGEDLRQAAWKRFWKTINDPKVRSVVPNLGALDEFHAQREFNRLAESKTDLHSILKCEEAGVNGVTHVGYHADHSFSLQVGDRGFGNLDEGLSAISNYAFQGAASDVVEKRVGELKQNGVPFLRSVTDELVAKRSLVEAHPNRKNEDYEVLGQEFGQVLGGNILRTYAHAMGAKPSNAHIPLIKEVDEPGGDFQASLLEKIDGQALRNNPEGLLNSIDRTGHEFGKQISAAHFNLELEQDKAMNEGVPRIPPTGPSPEGKQEAMGIAADGVTHMATAIDESLDLGI
jgi:hypothetical protein